MLNKSVKVISYTALSLTLLMGKITIPTGYFEDEGSFASVPSKLNQGWGFSFNKAFACGEDTGEDTIECIGVYGTPPPDPWGGVDDSYDSEDTYEQDEDQEGDGGDDGSGTSNSHEQICSSILSDKPSDCSLTNVPDISPDGCSSFGIGQGWDNYFGSSCNTHDRCYTTPNSVQSACDSNFRVNMQAKCVREEQDGNTGFSSQCFSASWKYYNAVSAFGFIKFNTAQSNGKCAAWHDNKKANGC